MRDSSGKGCNTGSAAGKLWVIVQYAEDPDVFAGPSGVHRAVWPRKRNDREGPSSQRAPQTTA
jgi:hypothetical protein